MFSSVCCCSFVNRFLTWRYNKRLSRGQRKRDKKVWFYVEKEDFKASLGFGYVLCRLRELATAGFRVSGMATPRISWDVFVPSLLQTGTLLTRWEEVNRSPSVFNSYAILCGVKVKESGLLRWNFSSAFRAREACSFHHQQWCLLKFWSLISFVSQESNASQGLFFSVDKYGFFLAWREDDKVIEMIACSLATAVLKNSASRLAAESSLCLERGTTFWEILTCVNEIFKILGQYSGYLTFFS